MSDFLEAWFAHTPGLKVVAPANASDAHGLMLSCIADPDPCIFIECSRAYGTSSEVAAGVPIPLGQANIAREGSDATVVTYSEIVTRTLAAAVELEKEGISIEVVDLRTINPWDKETVLASVRKTGRLVVAHEAVRDFGVGAEITATVQEELFGLLKAPIKRLGAPFAPVPFGPLEAHYVVNAAQIADSVRSIIKSGALANAT